MKFLIKLTFLIASALMLPSCNSNNDFIELPSNLIGKWNGNISMEFYRMDTLFSASDFDVQLELDSDGTGSYGFAHTGAFVEVLWSVSLDEKFVFITIIDTFNPNEEISLNYRMDILERSANHHLWKHIGTRGANNNIQTEITYWDLNK